VAARTLPGKKGGAIRPTGLSRRPDSLPPLGLAMRVRLCLWRTAATLGHGTGSPEVRSAESECQHDGNPPFCPRCSWVFGLL
jgi:hypothetical protein